MAVRGRRATLNYATRSGGSLSHGQGPALPERAGDLAARRRYAEAVGPRRARARVPRDRAAAIRRRAHAVVPGRREERPARLVVPERARGARRDRRGDRGRAEVRRVALRPPRGGAAARTPRARRARVAGVARDLEQARDDPRGLLPRARYPALVDRGWRARRGRRGRV